MRKELLKGLTDEQILRSTATMDFMKAGRDMNINAVTADIIGIL